VASIYLGIAIYQTLKPEPVPIQKIDLRGDKNEDED